VGYLDETDRVAGAVEPTYATLGVAPSEDGHEEAQHLDFGDLDEDPLLREQ